MKRILLNLLMHSLLLAARIEAKVLPAAWLYATGRFSARQIIRWSKGTRQALYANGRHLLGADASDERLRAFAVAVVTNFTKFFIAMLRAPRDFPSRARLMETMVGREHGERVLEMNTGAICVTMHLGCYELGALLAERFQPAAVVYRPDPFHLVEKLRSKTRDFAAIGEITTNRHTFGVEVLDLLRRGGSIFVAGDLGFAGGRIGEEFEFLDGRARFHTWPARLSVASNTPILPCFVVPMDDGGEMHLRLESPILPEQFAGNPDRITRALVAKFEEYVRAYPEQWLILHRYWVE